FICKQVDRGVLTMRKVVSPAFLLLTTLTVAAMTFAQTSTSIVYNYAKIAYPGALLTEVNSINNSNVVVGSYLDSSSNSHGFIYRNGKFTAINFPGATDTEVFGINDFGDIVGLYQTAGPLNFHGFVRHAGVFTSIDDPDATFGTMALGINKSGEVVGSYDNAHGFVFENGHYRTVNAPQFAGETPNTQLNGLNNLGWIAGQVFTGGIWRGFWIVGKDLDFVQAAGTVDSQVTGVNGHGDIVGCHDAQAGFVSFAVENGEKSETSEPFPTQVALISCPSAINYARVVVGNFFTIKQPNGFLGVPALTLNVTAPANHATVANPVRVSASAFGNNPISQIQVWVNSKQVFHINGKTLSISLMLPTGSNERFVVQAVDSKGVTTKVVEAISVH
ncbi:MAG TPA: Ig-like domain-containing protein, partial [Terriglobales bacterium]